MSMTYQQLVMPDPFIPCKPGWCLQYVRQAFGAPAVEPTATAGWENAKYRHEDTDFPENVWVPLWFGLENEPAGHVVLRAPDGSIYSTTSPTGTTATHHPNINDLYLAYQRYNPLTYRGWSEDISGVRVVQEFSVTLEGITVDDMSAEDSAKLDKIITNQETLIGLHTTTIGMLNNMAEWMNDQTPIQEENQGNIRKVTMETVYGQDAK